MQRNPRPVSATAWKRFTIRWWRDERLEKGNLFNSETMPSGCCGKIRLASEALRLAGGLARAERQLAEAEASCNENLIHELRNKVARFEHAKHRMKTTRNIVYCTRGDDAIRAEEMFPEPTAAPEGPLSIDTAGALARRNQRDVDHRTDDGKGTRPGAPGSCDRAEGAADHANSARRDGSLGVTTKRKSGNGWTRKRASWSQCAKRKRSERFLS